MTTACDIPTQLPQWPAGIAWALPPGPVPRMRPRYRPLTDAQLFDLDEIRLVAHVAEAKRQGDLEQARRAVQMLMFVHEAKMRRRVGLRLPDHLAHHEEVVASWVLKKVLESALKLQLEGESIGEWVSWWSTAIDRQVISFWRSAQGQALEKEAKLAAAGEGDNAADGLERVSDGFDVDRLVAQTCYAIVVADVIDRMQNEAHVKVVRMSMHDLPSADIAARLGLTIANVDKITSRFRRDLKAECLARGIEP